MRNLRLIVVREFLTRIRRRSFLLATLITPLGFGLFLILIQYILQYGSDETARIVIVDEGNILNGTLADSENLYFRFSTENLSQLRARSGEEGFTGVLLLPEPGDPLRQDFHVHYYSDQKLSLVHETLLRERLGQALRRYKIEALRLDERSLDALDTDLTVQTYPLLQSSAQGNWMAGRIAAAIGVLMGLVMYITVFIYGMMVMRSVMEEKTNRIVEVMISCVRPFHLMLGKIIGVGAVGLVQVLAWGILIPVILFLVTLWFGFSGAEPAMPAAGTDLSEFDPVNTEAFITEAIVAIGDLNWWGILPLFVIYFLGGYFMYASLFAAVGSAMGDDLGEGQSLTIPITIPVIVAFYIMIATIQAPNSTLAVFSSLFPLFSPIVMPARLPFDPPWWQVALSALFLILAALALVWLSSRIYRIGILTYGKRVRMRQLLRWLFQPS